MGKRCSECGAVCVPFVSIYGSIIADCWYLPARPRRRIVGPKQSKGPDCHSIVVTEAQCRGYTLRYSSPCNKELV